MNSQQQQLILRTAVHYLRTTVKADRAIAVYDGYGLSHGFEPDSLWDRADLSLGILESLIESRQPTLVADPMEHPVFSERVTTMLSNIGAVIFLPLHDKAGTMRGFLYLDQSRQAKVILTKAILERIQGYVNETLEPMLHSLSPELTWEEVQEVEWLKPPEPGPAAP